MNFGVWTFSGLKLTIYARLHRSYRQLWTNLESRGILFKPPNLDFLDFLLLFSWPALDFCLVAKMPLFFVLQKNIYITNQPAWMLSKKGLIGTPPKTWNIVLPFWNGSFLGDTLVFGCNIKLGGGFNPSEKQSRQIGGRISPGIGILKFKKKTSLRNFISWATKKTFRFFPWNTGCLIGILIIDNYNPHVTG